MIGFGVLAAFLILLGILALPYSGVIALVCAALALLIIGGTAVRQRERLPRLLIITVAGCVLGVLGWTVLLMPWANVEIVSDVRTLNPSGQAGAALVVYHPGRSDLQTRGATGFADGLADAGWRVDVTTASAQMPSDLDGYDLLVVGAQSYTWAPAQPVQAFLRRAGDLGGLPVVAILSGLGETGPASEVMRALVAEVGGSLIEIYNLWQFRPIDELYGTDDPAAAMRGAAAALTLPR
jgi:hypothetical protein